MRNSVLTALFLLVIVFSGVNCMKDRSCSPKTPTSEANQIQAYAVTNGLNLTPHSSGLYYEILNPGSGATASLTSKITITYSGKLLNGSVFDQRTTPNDPAWALSDLIEGWRVGIPLIQEGGHIRLLIPSAMAYGCNGYGAIPGDAILDFDINLVDVVP